MNAKEIIRLPWRQILAKGSRLRMAKRGCGLVVSIPSTIAGKRKNGKLYLMHVTTGDPMLDSLVLINVKAMAARKRNQ